MDSLSESTSIPLSLPTNSDLSSENQLPKSDIPPSIHPNNEETKPLFRFRNYGNKKEIGKKYYKCTFNGCSAKYQSISLKDNKDSKSRILKFVNDHNHPPISNPRIRQEVKEKAIIQFSAGATPSNVHAGLIRDAPLPLSSADAPTLSQVKKWKHEFSMKEMPSGEQINLYNALLTSHTGDVITNIIQKHGNTFVRKCEVHSVIHVAMASSFGLELLMKSNYLICDGTFDTTECKGGKRSIHVRRKYSA